MLRDIAHPAAGTVRQVVSPLNFRNASLEFNRAPPMLGEHTRQILDEIGWPARNGESR
jgi:crotonobetainyl-CoA:carnitine CoA-transferase CaiB-like acyl-CoA transferase